MTWRNTLEQQALVNRLREEQATRVRTYTKPSRPAGRPLGRTLAESRRLATLAVNAVRDERISLAEAERRFGVAAATIRAYLRKSGGAS